MAPQKGYTGFEGGEADGFTLSGARVVGDRPYTGDFCLNVHKTGAGGAQNASLTNTFAGGTNKHAKMGFRMRVNDAYPSVSNLTLGGFTSAGTPGGRMEIDSTGHIRAYAQTAVSSYSSIALSLNTFYWIEIEYTVQVNFDAGNNDHAITSIDVYDATRTNLLFNVTATFTTASIADTTLQPATVGEVNGTAVVLDASFDDLMFVADESTIVVGPSSPVAITFFTGTRVSPIYIFGQGSQAAWTNDWRNCRDVPMDTVLATTEQTTSTNGATTTFQKKTTTELGISSIEGTKISARMKAASGGNDAIMWNGAEFSVAISTGYDTDSVYDFTALSNSAFDAAEFGARNKRGVSLQLGKIFAEVLHAGTPPDPQPGVESWKSKIIKYTGNGTFQTITGVGFTAQFLLIKKTSGTGGSGLVWNRRMGGTISKRIGDAANLDTIAVQAVNSDGFELGPSEQVNESGVTYVCLAIQDGGQGGEGYYFDYGSYWGDGVDNRNIVIPANFQPELVITFGFNTAIYRDTSFVGDASMQLASSATIINQIQALNANGFQVGNASVINSSAVYYPWIAIRRGSLSAIASFFSFGNFTAVAGTHTVTGIPFSPILAISDRPNTGDAAWRCSLHHTSSNSTNWSAVTTTTTAFTSLTSDGFVVGSQLAVSGETARWVAFGDGQVSVLNLTVVNQLEEDVCLGIVTEGDFANIGIGEIVIGSAIKLTDGVAKVKVSTVFHDAGEGETDYGYSYRAQSGVLSRKLNLDFTQMNPTLRADLFNIFDGSVDMTYSVGATATVSGGPAGSVTIVSGAPALSGVPAVTGVPYVQYPASNLVDGSAQTVAKARFPSTGTKEVLYVVDLGSPQTPDLIAIVNTNLRSFPEIDRVEIAASASSSFAVKLLERAIGVKYPNMWLDLRGFAVTARYWRVRVFLGSTLTDYWTTGYNDSLTNPLFPVSRVLMVPSGLSGRVLVVPDSRKNECFWVDLPDTLALTHARSLLEASASIDLLEETPGAM